ncbi:MAG: ribosome maturation factor RimM [SAR202 cluster bacterium]|nr:ribosome maturation factor RimM [SAR202 cluster bacterium]
MKVDANNDSSDAVLVGVVIGSWGLKGHLKVKPFTDIDNRYRIGNSVWISSEELKILTSRFLESKGYWIISFEGINSLQKTERFFGCDITIPRKLLEILPPDVFYFYDLIGITVFNQDFVEIGILKDILKTGANDVYVIQPKSGKEILIPAIKEVVKKVDLENEKMYVVLRDGIE